MTDMIMCKCGFLCSEICYSKTDGNCPKCKKPNKNMVTKYKEEV